jgi:hypothetical protein
MLNHIASPNCETEGSPLHCPIHGKVYTKRFLMPKPGPERQPPNSYAVAHYVCERCFQQKTHCEDCGVTLEGNDLGYTRCKPCFDKVYQ